MHRLDQIRRNTTLRLPLTAFGGRCSAETFARGGVGQAGVNTQPFRAWIDDWIFEAREEAPGGPDATGYQAP